MTVRAYGIAAATLAAGMLALFGLVQALQVPVLADETPDLGAAGPGAAMAAVGLLVVDVFLPVPSSALMIANGALFGVVAGAALSLAGSVGAAIVGFAVGRRGQGLLARLAPAETARAAAGALERRGALAVVLSRPVPILAETTAILAGASGMPLRRLVLASILGGIPPAIVYAVAGALVVDAAGSALVFGGVVIAAAALWALDRRRARSA